MVADYVVMYIEAVPNRSSPPAILLRESYREDGKVKKRTLANLTHWPSDKVEGLRRVLRDETLVCAEDAFECVRSLPHGHVVAVLGALKKIGLDRLISSKRSSERDRVLALIVQRILAPGSKLSTARALAPETATSTLGEVLGISGCSEDELYAAMDWLAKKQQAIESKLAARHLSGGSLILYDITSTWFEGRKCPLARIGHSRDGKKGTLQIVIGILATQEGIPVAVEVFEGNTGDPSTVSAQVEKVRERFGLDRVVLVGDRGMLTDARIREDLRPREGISWISSLRAPAIRKLVQQGTIDRSLFDETDLAEVRSPDFPGERLVVCCNPLLADERARKRDELLAATERELEKIAEATRRARRPLRGEAQIGLRVGKVIDRFKVAKHFHIEISETSFAYERNEEHIEQERALDGIYVVRSDVPEQELSAEDLVEAYKGLSRLERVFRCMKTVDLKVRPIFHHNEQRVRTHVFLCMLAYYVEWHMRRDLAPLLFDDHCREEARAARRSIVAKAERSQPALRKARRKLTDEGEPVSSFQDLLGQLATIARNRVRATGQKDTSEFEMTSTPTALQGRAFELLGVSPRL